MGLLAPVVTGTTTHSTLHGTVNLGQEFGANSRTGLVILDEEHSRFPGTPQIVLLLVHGDHLC